MSSDHLINVLARAWAETKAELAAKLEGEDLEDAIGDPFEFVANLCGTDAAVRFFIQFSVRSTGEPLRALAQMVSYRDSPPPWEEELDSLGQRQYGTASPAAWKSYRGRDARAELAVKLAMERAMAGATRKSEDLLQAIGEPLEFLSNQIGQAAAVAYCLHFNDMAIETSLRALAWLLVCQDDPEPLRTFLSRFAPKEELDIDRMQLDSLLVQ